MKEVISIRAGALLERTVKKILEQAGFSPEINRRKDGYEVDVFLNYAGQKIGFECKEFAAPPAPSRIRNIICEWNTKRCEIGLNKVVLVIFGTRLTDEHYKIAKKFGLILWDTEKIDKMQTFSIRKNAKAIFLKELKMNKPLINRLIVDPLINLFKGHKSIEIKNIPDENSEKEHIKVKEHKVHKRKHHRHHHRHKRHRRRHHRKHRRYGR